MSELTPNLGLFKYNPLTDGKEVFSINTALNNNWDILDERCGRQRNIGEIVTSTIPLTDAGLHLLDGALIDGSGIYSAFVDYIADLYTDSPNASYFCQGESLQPWTQPVLTSNGTMGGNSYACDASSVESDYYAWKAFDNNTSTRWGSSSNAFPDWITFYSPVPLRVSSVYLHFYESTEVYSAGEIQGSNDNSTWTTLASFNNNSSLELNVPISTNVSYKYIRFYGTATVGSPWGKISKFQIAAQQGQELTAEQEWQQSITTYGVCGKFVYNSTNNTVRLPKITGKVDGTTDINALGDLAEQYVKLPNIIGQFQNSGNVASFQNFSGAFYGTTGTYNAQANGSGSYSLSKSVKLDASRSSSIYTGNGTDTTVHEQAINVLYYIVIATATKTDIQVDIDEVATDLNGKADVDLSNVPSSKGILTESYVNGTSWYRVYSDGWCEQGGTVTNVATSGYTTVNLLKPMANTNYTTLAINSAGAASYTGTYMVVTGAFTTTSFGIRMSGTSSTAQWKVEGYIEV